jgi:hypothetical protein
LEHARDRFRNDAPKSYSIYVERHWGELDLPSTISRHTHEEGRLAAVRALIAARIDVVRSLSRRQVDLLRRMVPDLYWPSPSQYDEREVALGAGLESPCLVPA